VVYSFAGRKLVFQGMSPLLPCKYTQNPLRNSKNIFQMFIHNSYKCNYVAIVFYNVRTVIALGEHVQIHENPLGFVYGVSPFHLLQMFLSL
jgi:hypothetical protein